eukprot:TRINITY_DN93556_c0_g1_i1.p1 TRINITY_DN93556_c0_g1~~TRINITY_DN93556_c0_g1_i1.p1  ORF type:complete len:471 (+),score=35.70 TRINITY_DN93556_c0_g1_i1:36-1415(+)
MKALVLLLLVVVCHSKTEKAGCGQPCTKVKTCGDDYCTKCLNVQNGRIVSKDGEKGFCIRGSVDGEPCLTDSDCFKPGSKNYTKYTCQEVKTKGKKPVMKRECRQSNKSSKSKVVGFIGVITAIVFFSVVFVPAKSFDAGDGVYFQWMMGIAILFAGLGVQLYRGCPPFVPYAMLGGVFWACGNVTAVPIINLLGMGLSIAIWNSINLLTGWASGHFGFFGITKETVSHPWANYLGVGVALVSTIVFSFVKPANMEQQAGGEDNEEDPIINAIRPPSPSTDDSPWFVQRAKKLPMAQKRILGIVGCVFAGMCYGITFDPSTALQNHFFKKGLSSVTHYSSNTMDYIFSYCLGITCTSTFHMIWYSALCKNRPRINPQTTLPALGSGFLWSLATVAWFIANNNLPLVVSFPIITVGPSVGSSVLGVIIYKEIQGKRNLGILTVGFAIVASAAGLIAYSQS